MKPDRPGAKLRRKPGRRSEYITADGIYEVIKTGSKWQVWRIVPSNLGVFEGPTLGRCRDYLNGRI